MTETTTSADVLIVGGGPSGALLATILSEWGRRVVLVERGGHRAGIPEETLVPGAEAILKRHGLLASIRAHDFVGTPRHGVIWGDGELQWRRLAPAERGFKVDRTLFDRDVRNLARAHEAIVWERASVPGPLPLGGEGEVAVDHGDGAKSRVDARVIVVATGKTPSAALVPVALAHQLPATTALSIILDTQQRLGDATVIEAVPEGWFWWLPLRDGRACLTLFADGDVVKKRGREAVWSSAVASASGPAAGLDVLPTFGSIATPRLISTPSRVLLVGDAASTIDPLSSQGLEKALASAEQVAVGVNTILERPDLRAQVVAHHRTWERGVYLSHARQSLGFYLNEIRFSDHPFWECRHAAVAREIVSDRPAELPSHVRLNPATERRPWLRRRGRVYEPVVGYGLADGLDVYDRLGRVPVEPVLALVEHVAEVDTIVRYAARQPSLQLLSSRLILQALTELYRLGIIERQTEESTGD